ncbi:hypothetical protein ABZV92_18910 [Streptomyces rubiginosohelvolus]|uniref:hypothetical protein n=1 Tax=Streptomyces rubiginosohelvolus TaxID=67362 RepID=UPI00339FC35C
MINRAQDESVPTDACPQCGATFASPWFPDGYSPSVGTLCANGLLDPSPNRAGCASRLLTYDQGSGQTLGRVLDSLSARLGPPSQYAGDNRGPSVRWRWPAQTVTLTAPRGLCPQVAVARTRELERAETTSFRRAAGAPPYLWRYQPGPACLPSPPAREAPSWDHLHEALQTVLRASSSDLIPLVGSEGAGFNIVDVRNHRWRLCVIVSPSENILLAVDDHGGPPGRVGAHSMRQRGWQTFVPLLRMWDAEFPLGDAGATSAARLLLSEMQHRNVRSPGDLRLTHVSSGDRGQLDIPGLCIPPAEPSDITPRAVAS